MPGCKQHGAHGVAVSHRRYAQNAIGIQVGGKRKIHPGNNNHHHGPYRTKGGGEHVGHGACKIHAVICARMAIGHHVATQKTRKMV